jgi:hypothetical protein
MARVLRDVKGVTLQLEFVEVALLSSLPNELRQYFDVVTDPEDPVYRRLFPHAYLDPTEDRAEMAFTAFVRPESSEQRLAALDAVTMALDEAIAQGTGSAEVLHLTLTFEEVDAWVRAMNEIRLVLGVRLDIGDEATSAATVAVTSDSNELQYRELYDWLSWLQHELVEALLPAYEGIPDYDL